MNSRLNQSQGYGTIDLITTPATGLNWSNKKMPKVRFHDLRHYHTSWLYNHDIPDQYAAKHLGHDTLILKSIYQHLGLSKEQEIDDKIRQLYNAPRPIKTQES